MRRPVVSVVMPAYNVSRFLPAALESLLEQTLGFEAIQVVVVDDGSTDETPNLLDEFAAGRSNVVVVHQENSGAPGGPRNRGIELSTGEFLFFLDPDDYLGTEALERMVAAARRNESDVVLGKIVGVNRNAPRTPFVRNVEHGDVHSTGAIWSMSAQKLFRRSLVVERGLRFAEGVRLGEDQEFVVGAYLFARGMSVVADYPCYYLCLRDDGGNATRTAADPRERYGVLERVLQLITRHTEPGPARNRLLRRFYTVEVLSHVAGSAFAQLTVPVRAEHVRWAVPLLRYFPDEVMTAFQAPNRLRGHLLKHGMAEELAELARFEAHETRRAPIVEGGRVYARLPFFRDHRGVPDSCFDITDEVLLDHCIERASLVQGRLRVSWEPFAPSLLAENLVWSLVFRGRRRDVEFSVPAAHAGAGRWAVDVDLLTVADGDGLPDGTWDLVVSVQRGEEEWRKFVGAAATLVDFRGLQVDLLDEQVVVLRANSVGRLLLDAGPAFTRLPAQVHAVECAPDDGHVLAVTGQFSVTGLRGERWTADLALRERTSGASVSFPASVTAPPVSAAPPGTALQRGFRAPVRLDDVNGLGRGVWDAVLVLRSGRAEVEGRLRAGTNDLPGLTAAVAGEHALVPYVTTAGNLSIDVGPTWRSLAVSADLRSIRFQPGSAQLEIRGSVRLVPRVHEPVPSVVLVLRQAAREVLLAGNTTFDGASAAGQTNRDTWASNAIVDLRQLATTGGIGPGRWDVCARVFAGPLVAEAPVRAVTGQALPSLGRRRWWWHSACTFLSARPLLAEGVLVLDIEPLRRPLGLRRRLARVVRRY